MVCQQKKKSIATIIKKTKLTDGASGFAKQLAFNTLVARTQLIKRRIAAYNSESEREAEVEK
jgi:hypothetical protein